MSSRSVSPPITPQSSDSEDDALESHPPVKRRYSQDKQPSPHPFAASTKANRKPPSYQKRYLFTPESSYTGRTITTAHSPRSSAPTTPDHSRGFPAPESESECWDRIISNAIDKAEYKIDLSFSKLTYIPPSISDLKGLFVLPKRELFPSPNPPGTTFKRSTTAPASAGLFNHSSGPLLPAPNIAVDTRPFTRAKTSRILPNLSSLPSQPSSTSGLELYLMGNPITTLPRELFDLDRLVVLSLRANKITSLPPAIRFLKALRELNIANNRISFLPAELQELRLNALHLHPNPYRTPPDMIMNPGHKRILGPLMRGQIIPSLKEFVLRYLLDSDGTQLTRMERALSLAEIDGLPLPQHLKITLRASMGQNQRLSTVRTNDSAELDIRSNVCPARYHHKTVEPFGNVRKNVQFFEEKPSVFHTPVEERMEWVGKVAQVTVGNAPEAFVPILWRGCSYGCLDFLTDSSKSNTGSPVRTTKFGSTIDENGDQFEFSDEE